MAAAKAYGAKGFNTLDPLTVSMTPPDATVALLKGGAQISAAFSVPPFQYQQLEDPAVHTVLNSFDVMGGSHTFTAVWTPAKFRTDNPVLYKALVEALKEATEIVNKDKKAAAALWIEDSKSKLPLDMVAKLVAGPQVRWTLTPENTIEICRLHVGGRHAEKQGGLVEGLFLPGDLWREGELILSASGRSARSPLRLSPRKRGPRATSKELNPRLRGDKRIGTVGSRHIFIVMAGLVPAISIRKAKPCPTKRDARDKPGHDSERWRRLRGDDNREYSPQNKTPGAGGATGSWARIRKVKVAIHLCRTPEPFRITEP